MIIKYMRKIKSAMRTKNSPRRTGPGGIGKKQFNIIRRVTIRIKTPVTILFDSI
jgi:hypothetical protein